MANRDIEMRFVAKFAHLVIQEKDPVDRIASGIAPEMLEDSTLATAYRVLSELHASGVGSDTVRITMDLNQAIGADTCFQLLDLAETWHYQRMDPNLETLEVLHHWQARSAAAYLQDLATACRSILKDDTRAALRATEDGVLKAQEILQRTGVSHAPRTRTEIAGAEREIVTAPRERVLRASWPYPKMRRALGDLLPGRMYGITAFPNAGKSTFAANLLYGFLRQGVPCLAVVTEMGDDWLRRAWAAEARVPQFVAENRLWDDDDPETIRFLRDYWRCTEHEVVATLDQCRTQYLAVVDDFPTLPCEVVEQSPITPEQVISRLRVLRRRFAGQFVVAFIDHLHNLQYPNDEVDKHVGVATARIRDFCRTDGAMAVVGLFQPKKPEKHVAAEYRPIYARDIRGQVAQVLDVHMSIFRQHVLTSLDTTPWGTRRCAVDPVTGHVRFCSQAEAAELGEDGEPRGKLDDEHLYIRPDKRRIGGEGRTFVLDFEADTGRVHEVDARRYLQAI